MSELAVEQEHLDRTYEAYDALLDALAVSRRDRHSDDFTEEVRVIAPAVLHDGLAAAVGHEVRESLSAGVNLVDLAAIKGLEFDAAVVVEPAAILDERPDGGRGGLYTALTRSTRALAVPPRAPAVARPRRGGRPARG